MSVAQCVSALDLYPKSEEPSVITRSPSALPPRSGALMLEATSSVNTLRVPSLNLSQTHANTDANMHKQCLDHMYSLACLTLMYTLTTVQPPSHPRFSPGPYCARWTSGFLISAAVNQQGRALRRDVQALVRTQRGLKSTLSHTSSSQYIGGRSPEEGGRCLVKVHVCYESGRIG